MPDSLLATKLVIPPPGPCHVDRPRLKLKLDGCLRPGCRLGLVSAPAGFGKTTLVQSWVSAETARNPALAAVWISLDEQDNDPIRFWSYLCMGLNCVEGQPGHGALTLLSSSPVFEPAPILTAILNDLVKLPGPIVIVLDDYHLIDSQAIHDSLAFFLDRLPPAVHFIFLTRSDPAFQLALFRGRGQLIEIRMADLRFSQEEASAFLNQQMGLALGLGAIQALTDKTEGWAAGLQMAALALQEAGSQTPESFIASFSGSQRFILDYLVEEVLKRQSTEVQRFLIRTSILDQMSAPLCDAILGKDDIPHDHDAQTILEYLENANLFVVRLDQERRWYRYHALFADLLRKRLLQDAPGQVKILHERASLWFQQAHFPALAVEHTFKAGNFALAAEILAGAADDVFSQGEYAWLSARVGRLPEELVYQYPLLCIYQAAIYVANGNLTDAQKSLQTLEKRLASSPEQLSSQSRYSGMIAALHALIAVFYQDIARTMHYAGMALEKLEQEEDAHWRAQLLITLSGLYMTNGKLPAARQSLLEALEIARRCRHAYMFLDATTHLVVILWMLGQLRMAGQICQDGLAFIKEYHLDETPVAGLVYLAWGFVLCEQHELDLAGGFIQRGRELSLASGSGLTMLWADQIWMRYLMARGLISAADEVTRTRYDDAGRVKFPLIVASGFSAVKLWVWIRAGKTWEAEQYFQNVPIGLEEPIDQARQGEFIALTYLMRVRGKLEAAESLLARFIHWAEAENQVYWLICALVNISVVERGLNKLPKAADSLSKAIQLAEPEGYLQVFLDEQEAVSGLLEDAARSRLSIRGADWLKGVMGLSGEPVAAREGPGKSSESPISKLSQREIEVLLLIAEGLSNKEIAQRLYITVRTVKYHTTNIFTRLAVDNRIQAIAKARATGII